MTKSNGSGWNFDNSYTKLPEFFYSNTNPTPVKSPKIVKLNEALASSLGLDAKALQEAASILGGNELPGGAAPIAQAYAGHQFGHFTMLGDGRAILLGEQITPTGEHVDIQLKGPGRTPYSRGGDGRAALGPMLREYIISEAMYALGIPTTRSLAVVSTGQPVIRETSLPGAILTRVAASHIRVGTFQYAAKWGTVEDSRALADYAISRHYPELAGEGDKYLSFLKAVIERQAKLITQWQLVGFIHGVMNTDNMTISGETIDYGPCAFMDIYDPETVFSSIDVQGRYAYGNQQGIGGWNLSRFAESLLDLLHDNDEEAVKIAQDAISKYPELSRGYWLEGMRAKIGIFNAEDQDEVLINDLLNMMKQYRADFTNTFRALTREAHEESVLQGTTEFNDWFKRWHERLDRQDQSKDDSLQLMRKSNPSVIPRNHRVEEALEAAQQGDYSVLDRLLEALANPYDYDLVQEEYCKLPDSSGLPYRTYCGT